MKGQHQGVCTSSANRFLNAPRLLMHLLEFSRELKTNDKLLNKYHERYKFAFVQKCQDFTRQAFNFLCVSFRLTGDKDLENVRITLDSVSSK